MNMRNPKTYGCLALAFWSMAAIGRADVQEQVEQLTGSRTRVVWAQQVFGDGSDAFATNAVFHLMGFDSQQDAVPRPIVGVVTNVQKPLITADGECVVFSDFPNNQVYVANWDGTGLRFLAEGVATEVWRDPLTGEEWVYLLPEGASGAAFVGGPMLRHSLHQPEVFESVWESPDVSIHNFQLSEDGTRASGLFPWPHAGIADLSNRTWTKMGKGCWTSMAPNNSYLFWVFDGQHRNVLMISPWNGKKWTVNINDAPGIEGYEVYHPRWSNHPRIMAMTGPYKGGEGANRIGAGGRAVEIYLGRFSPGYDDVEQWVRITRNDKADFFPDVWVEDADAVLSEIQTDEQEGHGEGTQQRESVSAAPIRVNGKLVEMSSTPSLQAIAPYKQALVVHCYEISAEDRESLGLDRILVAHWGIKEGVVLPVTLEVGKKYDLMLEPFDAHPELEGERVVLDVEEFDLPMYYDVRP